MTEVVKRQNSKSKKSFNQVTQIMVLLLLVTGRQPDSAGRGAGQESSSLGKLSVGHQAWPRGAQLPVPAQGQRTKPSSSLTRTLFLSADQRVPDQSRQGPDYRSPVLLRCVPRPG